MLLGKASADHLFPCRWKHLRTAPDDGLVRVAAGVCPFPLRLYSRLFADFGTATRFSDPGMEDQSCRAPVQTWIW